MRAVRAPLRSRRAFVATVMPWARATTAPASTSEASMAFITPSDWSLGVEGTLAVRILPSPSATRSVNVPPTSTPRRRFFTRSSLLLGEQPLFLGFLLVDILAVGLIGQEIAEYAKGAEHGDVDGDQGRPADTFHLRLLEREIPSVPKGLYRPDLHRAPALRQLLTPAPEAPTLLRKV